MFPKMRCYKPDRLLSKMAFAEVMASDKDHRITIVYVIYSCLFVNLVTEYWKL